ncbi:MAG: ABC transporter permease [Erysipelotrichaceae bacterium]|nr:ABC transporter permease [Erysipelotrichaceae bacterium]
MYLFKYILKRLGLMMITFFIITSICFVLVKMLPSLPAEQFGKDMALIMQRRELLGYNLPIIQQLFRFWKYALRGNFGVSEVLYIGQDVWKVFIQKLPYTVALNVYAITVSIPLGIGLGIFAALRKNTWIDHVISTSVMIVVSVPSFVYAFLVLYILYFKLGWASATMDTSMGAFSWVGFKSMIPAIISMSFGTIAGFTRFTRAELIEVLTSEFMLLARTKGLTKAQATLRHAMRNAMVPIFPMILGEFISIMGGSLIIEGAFSIPGEGKLYINSIQASPPDYNFFMLESAFYTMIGLAAGIVIDISYSIIDPRIRMGAK